MSDDKQKNEGEGLYQSQWYKCPNSMIDWVAGVELKPGALVVAMTVMRYTVGMGGKKSAAIPTEVFMRVLGTNREKTAYTHVKEAVDSGLVQVIKKQGCVSVYSINQESDLWHLSPVVAESASSGEKCHKVVAESATGVVAESATGVVAESATLIKKEENIKDNIKESNKKENEQAISLVDYWNNNHGKNKSADVKPSVWLDKVKARLKKFSSDEIKLAMLSVIQSSWHQQNGQVLIKNAISSDQRCDEAISRYHQSNPISYQGNNNANNQSANSQPQQYDTSTTAGYAAKLDADAERYYAEQSAIAQQAADGSFEGTF